VCLIKLDRDANEAYRLLQQALQGSAVVRTIPPDALFWLGRAQQMTGRFAEAIASYNEFTELYGKKAARDLDIPGYLQQCQDKKGQITGNGSKQPAAETLTQKPENKTDPAPERINTATTITEKVHDTVPAGFDLILSEALEYQFMADSLTRVADGWKTGLDKLDYKRKTELRTRIADTEKLSASYQKKADQKYDEAQVSMNSGSFSQVKIVEKEQKPDSAAVKKAVPEPALQKAVTVVRRDSTQVISAETYSVFAIKPTESVSGNKVPINATIPRD